MNLIFIIGFMASGKTTFGKKLAAKMHYNFVDLDFEIEQQTQLTISEIFERNGESFFRKKEQEVLQSITSKTNQKTIVSCGGGTPFFYDNFERMKQNGKVVFLNTDFEIILKRIQNTINKKVRPLLYITDKKIENSLMIKQLYANRIEKYLMADLEINEQNQSIADISRLLK